MKKIFKKIILPLFIILLSILLIYIFHNSIFLKLKNKYKLENNSLEISQNIQNSPFSISKIIIYSSGYGENKNTTFEKNNWILDILQYSDIAIYIDNSNNELTAKNTVKKLSLENISISNPKIGKSSLYYLDSLNFGTPNIDLNYTIQNSLEFTVLNDNNSQNYIQFNTPVFFADCSNPITLKYVNNPIKENYVLTSNEPIFFNGKLLQIADISLNDLSATIQLTINIENYENEKYSYNLSIPITLENENSSIYDGDILIENEYKNYKFFKQ